MDAAEKDVRSRRLCASVRRTTWADEPPDVDEPDVEEETAERSEVELRETFGRFAPVGGTAAGSSSSLIFRVSLIP